MADTIQSLADLQAEYKAKIEKALSNAKTKLKTELDLAVLTFGSIVEAGETGIWSSPTLAPILKDLGLQPVSSQAIATVKRRGRGKAKGTAKIVKATTPAKAPAKRVKGGNKDLTPTETKIYDFLGKDGKKNAEINKHFKMANSSVNTTKMKVKGFIVKKAGKWHQK
jgi:hypothetical protein